MKVAFSDAEEQRAWYEGLTRHNYFPNQREGVGELPPCFDTRQFTPEVAEELAELGEQGGRNFSGYDLVEYRATRYNNVPRILGLIHPKAYALLAKSIHDNWQHLESVSRNERSLIKPELHEDGRIVVMNYEDPTDKVTRGHIKGFGRRYRVQADISNCFQSIYSHAIPWALVGIPEAKKNRGHKEWFNQIDKFQRKAKRNETQGIPIGPATSSIVVESILNRVDKCLADLGFEHYRYVDDYTCYCKTSEEAERFVRELAEQLALYKLSLNLKKTVIEPLPAPSEESWVLELRGVLPSRLGQEGEDAAELTAAEAVTFLNHAIAVNQVTPDGSVLKYAFSCIRPFINSGAQIPCLDLLVNLAWHYPILIPLIDGYLDKGNLSADLYREQLNTLIQENAEHKRTDGMVWPLYIMLKHGLHCESKTAECVLVSRDCAAITLLFEMGVAEAEVIQFARDISTDDLYTRDNYWLLLYQVFFKGKIDDPYKDGVFNNLKANKVNFLPGDSITPAEQQCKQIADQIAAEVFTKAFELDGTEEQAF